MFLKFHTLIHTDLFVNLILMTNVFYDGQKVTAAIFALGQYMYFLLDINSLFIPALGFYQNLMENLKNF